MCGRLSCPLCFDALITYIRCVGEINIDSIPPAPLGMNVSNMETIILLCEQYNGMEQQLFSSEFATWLALSADPAW